jgi:hypothetical protein
VRQKTLTHQRPRQAQIFPSRERTDLAHETRIATLGVMKASRLRNTLKSSQKFADITNIHIHCDERSVDCVNKSSRRKPNASTALGFTLSAIVYSQTLGVRLHKQWNELFKAATTCSKVERKEIPVPKHHAITTHGEVELHHKCGTRYRWAASRSGRFTPSG